MFNHVTVRQLAATVNSIAEKLLIDLATTDYKTAVVRVLDLQSGTKDILDGIGKEDN